MIQEKVKSFHDQVARGRERIGIVVHPCTKADTIIINCPGHRGSIDGYNNKYITLADHLVEQGVGAVVRMPNIERAKERYYPELVADVESVINYCILHAGDMAATKFPDIYLMGFSAGGYAVAYAAAETPRVKRVLLMAPAGPSNRVFAAFKGRVYIAIGDKDDNVGVDAGKKYYDLATRAMHREHKVIPNCDHQFTGRINGQIMAKAPFWAFAGDKTFPSPEGGIVLYD